MALIGMVALPSTTGASSTAQQHLAAHAAIIGGQPAQPGTFPWMAYILDFDGEGAGQCSGTVVAPNLVLTAGHCAENTQSGTLDQASGYRVLTGNVYSSAPETQAQVSAVSRVIVCPCFDRHTKIGDVALLELSTPTRAPAVALAPLPRGGAEAIVAGWGDIYYKQNAPVEQLRWAQTVVQRPAWCEREASPFSPSSETCTIEQPGRQTGVCNGDSGGPLLLREPAAIGAMVQIGITSHVYGDCATTSPSVFTRADAISAWIGGWAQALAPGAPVSASSANLVGPVLPGIASGRSFALRHGVVSFVLDCDSEGGTCVGGAQASVTLREKLILQSNDVRTVSMHIRRVVLATASFAIASGASVAIRSRLSSQKQALLSHLLGERLDVSLTGSGVAHRVVVLGAA